MARELRVYRFRRGPDEFVIRQERRRGRVAFVGYFNGAPSVTAPGSDVAFRVLLKKHVERKEAAQVIRFQEAKSQLRNSKLETQYKG